MAKSKYEEWLTPEGLRKIEEWAELGLIKQQIAENMGISRKTLNEWENSYSAIGDAIKSGKVVPDENVENSLYKSAMGYKYDEITRELRENKDTGESEMVTTKIVTKEVQPSNTAQIFWLKNRKPNEWRDRRDIDITVSDREETVKELEGLFNCTPKSNGQT